jgi:protein-disulfide isomerase
MKTSTKINIIAVAAVIVVVGVIVAIAAIRPFSASKEEVAAATPVLEENSHRLDVAEDGAVTMVEFLDFECEACGALYPYIEQLREDYAGRVTFVVRYFPIPAHQNSTNAAVAVEAAAQQDRFEEMYTTMFETQASWGESQESKAPLFREFAAEIGLDLAAYDAAVADPATLERVQFDFDAGRNLGVQGTPTLFINGEKLTLESVDDLRAALDAALAS